MLTALCHLSVFFILTFPLILSIPADIDYNTAVSYKPDSIPSEPHVPLPFELISKIANLSDDKSNVMIGMTSKNYQKDTEKRNKKNRLLQIRTHCGFRLYLKLTSNGYHIFSDSIYDSFPVIQFNYGASSFYADFMMREARCVKALWSNIRDINDELTEISIYLPGAIDDRPQEVDSATNLYFEALEELFRKKSRFKKVSILSINLKFLHPDVEERIFVLLSRLIIDVIDIQFKIKNLRLFVNPSISTLRAPVQFFTKSHYPTFSNLSSVIFPDCSWHHYDFLRILCKLLSFIANYEDQPTFLHIMESASIKQMTTPYPLIPVILSKQSSVERLSILGSYGATADIGYLDALIDTGNHVSALKFGRYLSPPVEMISIILEKFKPSLNSLSVCFKYVDRIQWQELLRNFLSENKQLKELEVTLEEEEEEEAFFSHAFLEQAVNLKSYSFEGNTVSRAHFQSLFHFIATHKSLVSLSLKSLNWGEGAADSFLLFYEDLVDAIQANLSIQRVDLETYVGCSNQSAFALLFAEKTRPLVGRGLILNSIPVDNIVADVADGLKDGLFWSTRDDEEVQFFSIR